MYSYYSYTSKESLVVVNTGYFQFLKIFRCDVSSRRCEKYLTKASDKTLYLISLKSINYGHHETRVMCKN